MAGASFLRELARVQAHQRAIFSQVATGWTPRFRGLRNCALMRSLSWSFSQRSLTVSKVLLAAQPLLVVADEALQRSVLVLAALAEAAPEAWQGLVERVVFPKVGVGAELPRSGVDVGVVVAVGTDDQRAGATW